MKLSDITVMPPIVGLNVQERELWELAFSDNTRYCHLFRKMVRDGVQINGQLRLEHGIPEFHIKIAVEDRPASISVWLTPEYEHFLLKYLFTVLIQDSRHTLKITIFPIPIPTQIISTSI